MPGLLLLGLTGRQGRGHAALVQPLPVEGGDGGPGGTCQPRAVDDGAAGQHGLRHRLRVGAAVGQQRGDVDRVVPGVDTRGGQRAGVLAGLGVAPHPVAGALLLGGLLADLLAVREHHRTQGGGDQQRRGGLEDQHVAAEQQVRQRRDVALRLGGGQPDRVADHRIANGQDQQDADAQGRQDRRQPLAAQRLHQRVAGVHADQHQHEQEQHQDGAGVDDDLHREQERRVLGGVLHRQADHHRRQAERRVHRLAGQHHAERAEHHHRCQQPEGHRLRGGRDLQGDHLCSPACVGPAAASARVAPVSGSACGGRAAPVRVSGWPVVGSPRK